MNETQRGQWQEESPPDSIRRVREECGRLRSNNLSGYTSIATAYYSAIKHYSRFSLRAIWYAFQAARFAGMANRVRLRRSIVPEAKHYDVMSRVLMRVPWWLGGNEEMAAALIREALSVPGLNADPHTKAHFNVTLGMYELKRGRVESASIYYGRAEDLLPAIEVEGADGWQGQWVRVAKSVLRHKMKWVYQKKSHLLEAYTLVEKAEALAREYARSQLPEILAIRAGLKDW